MSNTSVGEQHNAWATGSTPGAGGFSNDFQVTDCKYMTAFGSASGATTITLQFSQDGTTFRDGPTQVLAGAGDFYFNITTGCRRVRLKTSAAVTVSGTITGK